MANNNVMITILSYADLLDVATRWKSGDSPTDTTSTSITAREKVVLEAIERAFGRSGLGIVAVSDIPQYDELRRHLLPLAAQIPNLPDLSDVISPESLYSVGWSRGKERVNRGNNASSQSSVGDDDENSNKDENKGSFYANPLTNDLAMELQERAALNHGADYEELAKIHPEFFAKNVWPSKSLPSLEPAFCNMGRLLHQVGSLIAIVCDEYCKQNGIVTDLTKIITNSLNAKGRLLHYFPSNSTLASTTTEDSSDVSMETSWCGWHNDHGALTGLALPALYLDENQQEVIGRDALASAGLYVMARDGVPVRVELSKDVSNCCAFQIGETAQILSGGLLRATPHMVRAPTHSRSLLMTRSSFALFLQPEFHYPLCLPQKQNETGRTTMLQPDSSSLFPEDNDQNHRLRLSPLEHRWKNGQTFGEFHLATVSAFTVD